MKTLSRIKLTGFDQEASFSADEVRLIAVILPRLESNSNNPLADHFINMKRAAVVDHAVTLMKNFACVGHQKARDRRVSIALRD